MSKEAADALFPMMDDVHRFLFKGWKGSKNNETFQFHLRRYREQLRRARRFVINDDMVRLTCHLAHEQPKIGTWAVLARLPYDTIWIELDLHTKVHEFESMGTLQHPFDPSQVSPRAGYLMQREPDSTRWIATEFVYLSKEKEFTWEGFDKNPNPWSTDDAEIVPSPTVIVFDPEGTSFRQVTGSTILKSPTYSFMDDSIPLRCEIQVGNHLVETMIDPEFALVGMYEPPETGVIPIDQVRAVPPAWAQFKVAAVPEPLWAAHYSDPKKHKGLMRLVAHDMQERAGLLRYLICLLGSMNDAPTSHRDVKGRKGERTVGAHRLKYFDHSVVTINVPKSKALKFVSRELDKAATQAQRALHQVRGHYRVIEYGHRLPYVCRHVPLLMEDGVGFCERCERMIRWIDDHQRGDPRLGITEPSYVVTRNVS
jgi:hypothetical protein